jgi:hypothetical protein
MAESGDCWRDHREHRRKARRHYVECPHCAVAFGGNGTKVPPGEKCRNCDWRAPAPEGGQDE